MVENNSADVATPNRHRFDNLAEKYTQLRVDANLPIPTPDQTAIAVLPSTKNLTHGYTLHPNPPGINPFVTGHFYHRRCGTRIHHYGQPGANPCLTTPASDCAVEAAGFPFDKPFTRGIYAPSFTLVAQAKPAIIWATSDYIAAQQLLVAVNLVARRICRLWVLGIRRKRESLRRWEKAAVRYLSTSTAADARRARPSPPPYAPKLVPPDIGVCRHFGAAQTPRKR
jgi:hypothetical protein